jgi:hypothetical protein
MTMQANEATTMQQKMIGNICKRLSSRKLFILESSLYLSMSYPYYALANFSPGMALSLILLVSGRATLARL